MIKDKRKTAQIITISALCILILALSILLTMFFKQNQKLKQENTENKKQYESLSQQQNDLMKKSNEEQESLKKEAEEKESIFNQDKRKLEQKISELQKQIALKPTNTNGKKVVYLTFDDGPSPRTPDVLEILKRENIKATFFVVNGHSYNHYMKDIVAQGHKIALHTYTHDYKQIYSSDEAFLKDLNAISDLVYSQTGIRSKLMRFPGGSSNTVSRKYSNKIMTRLTKKVTELGYTYFDWNISSGDATYPTPTAEKIIENCKHLPKNSNSIIVLFHDSKAKQNTVAALPKIISYYKSLGYTFASLNEHVPPAHQRVAN